MESFIWSPAFETGLKEVDAQHQELVALINEYGDHVANSPDIKAEEIDRLFTALAEYADYHFVEEETLMRESGLGQDYVAAHHDQHAHFLEQVSRFFADLTPNDREGQRRLLMFLVHWLAYHILGTDKVMARQVELIQSGMAAEEALHAAGQGFGKEAMEPLLKALNDLFLEVMKRNRELSELNESLELKVRDRTAELNAANQRLEELANTDLLTGLPNRRHALSRLTLAWDDSLRRGEPLACLLLDADHFKAINDTYGHDAGDVVIRELGQHLRDCLRTDDLVARMGGDEFLIILPRTDLAGAMRVGWELRDHITSLRIQAGAGVWKGSLSIGAAERDATQPDYEALIKAADEGLYAAKRKGRNTVAVADGAGAPAVGD